MSNDKPAIIIPTKDRPDKLKGLLSSIAAEKIYPLRIIVVDGGSVRAEEVVKEFPQLNIKYTRSPGSLTIQRNIGIKLLDDDITLVAFFDDDIILNEGSFGAMMRFWQSAGPETGGASFNVVTHVYKKPNMIERIFLINADIPGRMLRSGFQSKLFSLHDTVQVQWLLGGATVWRRSIFNTFLYDEWFSGYARYEDVDFSYSVGKKYKMFIVSDAQVKHLNTLENVSFSFTLGKMQVVNRFYLVSKYPELSKTLCLWACLGLFINNVIKGIFYMNKRYIRRAMGNIAGFAKILMDRILLFFRRTYL